MLNNIDIPRLDALGKYWADHPPVQWMVASYFGIGDKKSASRNIEEANEFVPVETVPKAEFDALLSGFGIPVVGSNIDLIGSDKCQIKTQN